MNYGLASLPLSRALVYDRAVNKPPHLHVIVGTPAPDTPKERIYKRLRRLPKPKCLLTCPRCAGIEVIFVKLGVFFSKGKTTGGTKVALCALCFRKGDRVVLC